MRRLGLSISLALLAFAGCSKQRQVVVVDMAGNPVQGADVAPVSMDINGLPQKTDAAGVASVDLNYYSIEPAKWIDIRKAGFDPIFVDIPAKWPLRVTLAPVGTSKLGVQLTTRP